MTNKPEAKHDAENNCWKVTMGDEVWKFRYIHHAKSFMDQLKINRTFVLMNNKKNQTTELPR